MSQIDSEMASGELHEPAPMSIAAVSSLVLSLILCIPGLSVLGLIFGIVGFATTGGGVRRGRGLAVTGIIFSLLVSAGWLTLLWLSSFILPSIMFVITGPQLVMEEAFQGNATEVRAVFIPESAPDDASTAKFVSTLREQYGEFEQVLPDDGDSPPFGAQAFTLPFQFEFSNGMVLGSVDFEVSEVPTSSESYMRIKTIRLSPSDPAQMDVTLGGSSSEPAKADSESSP
jgi:hypothetical protein